MQIPLLGTLLSAIGRLFRKQQQQDVRDDGRGVQAGGNVEHSTIDQSTKLEVTSGLPADAVERIMNRMLDARGAQASNAEQSADPILKSKSFWWGRLFSATAALSSRRPRPVAETFDIFTWDEFVAEFFALGPRDEIWASLVHEDPDRFRLQDFVLRLPEAERASEVDPLGRLVSMVAILEKPDRLHG